MNGTERKGIQVRYFFIALARYCINRFMHEEFGWTNYCINRMFGRKTAGSLILSGNDAIFANANAPKKVQNFPLVRPDWRRNAGFFLSCVRGCWWHLKCGFDCAFIGFSIFPQLSYCPELLWTYIFSSLFTHQRVFPRSCLTEVK